MPIGFGLKLPAYKPPPLHLPDNNISFRYVNPVSNPFYESEPAHPPDLSPCQYFSYRQFLQLME